MDQWSNPSSSKGEVLVVDDTVESLAYLSELLTQEGYYVRAAPNGELALWTAHSSPPELVLLDVRMPGLNGFEVCARLKADPRTAGVPVIFLSAQTDVEDKVHGFLAGGVDYIGKPFASEEVFQRVATHIRLARVEHELMQEKLTLETRVKERTRELEETTTALRGENTARRAAEEGLRLAASAFEASLSAMFITTLEGTIVSVNRAFTVMTGYAAAECIGRNAGLLNSGRHDNAFFRNYWKALQTDGKWSGEIWNRRKDGNMFPCMHTATTVKNAEGEPLNYVGVFLDLSESKDAQTLIDFLTRHDSLTGLPNRVLVHDRFGQMVNTLDEATETIAVICINLNRFRLINDFHGYSAGNSVLQWVAAQIAECLPSRDTVFRESGDEFVIVHRGEADLLGITLLIDLLYSKLNAEVVIEGSDIAVSASIGTALYPNDGNSLEELVGNAAIAMTRAKELGGEGHAFFSEQRDHGVRTRFDIARRLRHALDHGEFEVHYQPQISSQGGGVVAAEALLRWHTPELGPISPAQFIPVAEETGRIIEIGAWVLRDVCRQIARWQADGLGYIKVAVNLSAIQFMRHDLCDTVKSILQESGIPPQCLELEITEGAIIEDVQRAIVTMNAFKALGVTISLDDFGTGYSSLSYLRNFPIDYLKIDQSFVHDLIAESDAGAIVLSIIGLAHNLRMGVIAEGVETEAQSLFLSAQGCDLLQGYFFGKPMPADRFSALLLEQKTAIPELQQ